MRDEAEMIALKKLYKVIERVRHENEIFPVKRLAMLLTVAMEEGLPVEGISKRTGTTQQAASKHLADMGDFRQDKKKAGLRLIEYRQDRMNLSKKNVYLTKRGTDLIEHLVLIIIGGTKPKHEQKA